MSERRGWIGVDLDGTLLTYDRWVGWNVFGDVIQPMKDRVLRWLDDDCQVRIVTARVGLPLWMGHTPTLSNTPMRKCRVTGEWFSDAMMANAIGEHLKKHGLPVLPVQCYKDVDMIELWDDRAIQVIPNTGRTLAEEHESVVMALRGRAFQSKNDADMPFEHPSHNVSGSTFDCYGCGLRAGDPRLSEPCPTPDEVGRMRMERSK